MSQGRKFAAKITDKGELVVAEQLRWRAALARLKGQVVYVHLETFKATRSNQANKRYWCLLVPFVAEVLSAGRELPLSKDHTHWLLKHAFIGHEETPLGTFPKSSASLSVEEFADYTQKIEEWLATSYGIVIPERGESLEESVI